MPDMSEVVKYVVCGVTLLTAAIIIGRYIQIKYFHK